MNIGLFGDSYIDVRSGHPREKKFWIEHVADELEHNLINSGKGGSPLYYAVHEWQSMCDKVTIDYAVWALTWPSRIYIHQNSPYNLVNSPLKDVCFEKIDSLSSDQQLQLAAAMYYKHLYNEQYQEFIYELMIKYILELPDQYPNTRFIFVPNMGIARKLARKYFCQGVLVDVALDEISLLEGEDVTHGPWNMDKIGHITDQNQRKLADLVKPIFTNYEEYRNQTVPVALEQFRV